VGLLNVSVFVGRSNAGVLLLADLAVTPLPAVTVTALRWLPSLNEDALDFQTAFADSDLATSFQDSECSLWMKSSHDEIPSIFQDQSLTVLRAGTGSYHGYQAPTTLHTGYGCFFEEETWRLSHAGMQGIEEPGHFYLKLTFRF